MKIRSREAFSGICIFDLLLVRGPTARSILDDFIPPGSFSSENSSSWSLPSFVVPAPRFRTTKNPPLAGYGQAPPPTGASSPPPTRVNSPPTAGDRGGPPPPLVQHTPSRRQRSKQICGGARG